MNFWVLLCLPSSERPVSRTRRCAFCFCEINVHRHSLLMLMHSSGLDGAGKSSICAALLKEPLDEISPTLGFSIKTIEHDG